MDSDHPNLNENCPLLNLSFEILAKIFISAKNLELVTVSKLMYQISHNTSVQIQCVSWGKNFLQEKSLLYYRKRLWFNTNFLTAMIKKYPYNDVYCHVLNKALQTHNSDIVKFLLSKTRIDRINNPDDPETKLYIIRPLVAVNSIRRFLKLSPDKKTFNLLENAHKTELNVQQEHGITPEMVVNNKIKIIGHKPLHKNTYKDFFNFFVNQNNSEMVCHILSVLDLNYNEYTKCFETCVESDHLEMAKIIYEYGLDYGLLDKQEALEYSFQCTNPEIVEYVIDDIGIKMKSHELIELACRKNNINFITHTLKRTDIEHKYHKIFNLIADEYFVDALNLIVDKIDLAKVDHMTLTDLADIRNTKFLGKLIDIGFDISTDDDRMFVNCTNNSYRSGENNPFFSYKNPCTDDDIYRLLRRLLHLGANVYVNDSDYMEPLIKRNPEMAKLVLEYSFMPHPNTNLLFQVACFEQAIGIIRLLLRNNANLIRDNKKLIYELGRKEKFETLELLFEHGVSMNNNEGTYLLLVAIEEKKMDLINFLLKWDVQINYKTGIMFWYACKNQCYVVVERILKSGLLENKSIEYEFIIACRNNDITIIELILKYSSNEEKIILLDLNHGSPLNIVAKNDYRKSYEILLANGAKINRGRKLFIDGCHFGYVEIVKRNLQEQGKKINKKVLNKGILFAARFNMEIFNLCFELIKDSPKKILFKNTLNELCEIFCENGNLNVVKQVVELGADIKSIGNNTLVRLFNNGYMDILNYLSESGIDENQKNILKFINAISENNLQRVKSTFNSIIDINMYNSYALRVACEKGYLELVRLLLSNGAKPPLYAPVLLSKRMI
ncbi:hypothetical protein BB559_000258 [Furculomyces boomerangus]|uniref:Uncharacterized protein n=1 Tax=Furculomyces boomerangus TaxID=61424 RepID=A0A2T9Z5P9_9FUNG|nr:hypothetical protein BB559_000258 [Furculomyces boomerangus]